MAKKGQPCDMTIQFGVDADRKTLRKIGELLFIGEPEYNGVPKIERVL